MSVLQVTRDRGEDSPRNPTVSQGSVSRTNPPPANKNAEEDEVWRERVAVITKQDHLDYEHIAKEIIEGLVENIPATE